MSTLQSLKNIGHFVNASLALLVNGNPANALTIIGVTGTDGKTTTSTLIYSILKEANYKVALISTVAAFIGDKHIDTGFHVTSPTPWALQRLLRKIAQDRYSHVVLEATSHGLDQHRLLGINPEISVLTNVTHEHLDYHGTYDNYIQAKSKLFRASKQSVLNANDASLEPMRVLLAGKSRIHVYKAQDVPSYIKNQFKESYNQANAQAARTVAKLLAIDEATIEQGLRSFAGIPGRMEQIPNTRKVQIVVDFAHTPNALKSALSSLKKNTKGKLIAVYGAAGERDVLKRPQMGDIGARLSDVVILTSEDPRSENVESIIYQMKQGITKGHDKVISIPDRATAIEWAIDRIAQAGDTIGVFGKGHERSMNLDGKRETPWSDQDHIKKLLQSSK
jgi:UDP-N-acetylmuramoyl-L-alanyl-D-glutamate--2,6-diaminopimelate ligase